MAGALFFMAANDDGGCGGDLPDNGGSAECQVASDCTGPHIECVGGWQCAEGACEWHCGGQVGCQSDDQCERGQKCRDDGVCVDVSQGQGCYGDQDCGSGQHCNAAEVCHTPPGCNAGDACPAVCYGECVDGQTDQCTSDRDCGAGYYCGCAPWAADPAGIVACNLTCLPQETHGCSSDSDCAPDQACVNGVCGATSRDCYGDDQCGDGYYCDFSSCGGTAAGMAPPDGEADRPAPACPGVCAPKPTDVCADGTLCPRGTHCEDTCTGVCPPCACPDGQDCACACEQDCKSECVADNGNGCSSDSECGPGFYCGGCGETPMLPNGIIACERQCLPTQGDICHFDYECGQNQRCDLVACDGSGAPVPCDASDPNGSCPDDSDKRPIAPPDCWGYCVDQNPVCREDADCAGGYHCEIQWCTDAIPPSCGGTCQPNEQTGGECSTDWDCINAAGQQGTCQVICADAAGAQERPCNPDDPACTPRDPTCKGYCDYQDPVSCVVGDPTSCRPGTHCESACGWLPNGLVVNCPTQCVPDEKTCGSACDCGYGEQCKDGTCVQPEAFACDQNWQCPDGFMCGCAFNGGFGIACFPQCIPERPACCADSDCGDGNQCVDGQCQAWSCNDGQCPAGYECQSQCGGPTPFNGLIACPQVCVPAAKECASDCDCPSSESCLDGQCTIANRLNDCHASGCQADSDCQAGQECQTRCPPCACPVDADGNWGPCPQCVCESECVDKPVDPTTCSADSDCGAGRHCDVSACASFAPCFAPDGNGCGGCTGQCVDDAPPTGCQVTGCSGQVCAAQPTITTCEYRDWYQCYRLASCDAQPTGACGWTSNDAFKQCMIEHGGFNAAGQ